MFTLALDGSQIGIALLIVLFLIISVLMVLVVLIQRPQGGGLSGAFGASSDGAGQTAFGAKTGDALTTATILIFVLFLLTAVGLNLLIKPPAASAPAVGPAGTTAPEGAGEPTDEPAAGETPAGETPADDEAGDESAGDAGDAPTEEPAADQPGDEPVSDDPASEEPGSTDTPSA